MRPSTLLPLVLLTACRVLPEPANRAVVDDVHSFSEPNRVRVTHASLDLTLDFAKQEARGSVELAVKRIDPSAPLVLDTNGLIVESVTGQNGTPLEWTLGSEVERFGRPLTIRLRSVSERVRIRYRTTGASEAMQWLGPEQTAGGQQPFLFTQGQAILTRSWIPLQDTPGVRITYDARIRCPQGLTAVMSAERLGRDALGAWRFRLDEPVPPYLIALACGALEFREISKRTGVWAEPPVVETARAELEDTELMVQAAEKLFGPYRWGRFDVLVLPPSFPYGGMENPRLTFLTPTMLAGDKSLVALIAHELAHSWSGNLVTNATWRDFWLNEGFTVYLETRIMEAVYGKERADMEFSLSIDELEREMADMKPVNQILHVDLLDRHPDDGFSGVPYTKGASLLVRLEQVFGREAFDEWLASYFAEHAFQSIKTQDFAEYIHANLLADHPELAAQVDLCAWLTQPGLPDDLVRPSSSALQRVDAELARWAGGTPPRELATEGWATQQWLHFLEGAADRLDASSMAKLDRVFAFTRTGNNEILCVWLRLAVQHGYEPADERLDAFLTTVGRRKFLQPIYTELVKTEAGRERALAIYRRARPMYHSVSTRTLDKIVGWEG
jgi:aminopeptidase N